MSGNIKVSALTESTYYILLSLCEARHGYNIMQYVSDVSNNRVNLGPGTLYGAINTLVEKSWIKSISNDNSSRKKEYIITDLGKNVLKNEVDRLKELVKTGKKILGDE